MNTTRPTALHPHRQHTNLAELTQAARRTDWSRLAVALATALAIAVIVWKLLP